MSALEPSFGIQWSLNEVEATCRKAARGIGLPWGLAEEAGRAARWLNERGLPGTRLIAALLLRIDGTSYGDLTPTVTAEIVSGTKGPLCPLATGSLISDRDMTDRSVQIGALLCPALILPFVAGTCRTVTVRWGRAVIGVRGRDLWIAGDLSDVLVPQCKSVTLEPGLPVTSRWRPNGRPPVGQATAAILTALAERTYAPATEASRNAGAGGADV